MRILVFMSRIRSRRHVNTFSMVQCCILVAGFIRSEGWERWVWLWLVLLPFDVTTIAFIIILSCNIIVTIFEFHFYLAWQAEAAFYIVLFRVYCVLNIILIVITSKFLVERCVIRINSYIILMHCWILFLHNSIR